jgi:hypothetical protein
MRSIGSRVRIPIPRVSEFTRSAPFSEEFESLPALLGYDPMQL